MKKSELIQIFKEYLNTEVRKIIKEELSGLLTTIPQPVSERKVEPKSEKKPVKFNGKSAISSVLNEIAQNYQPDSDDFDTIDMGSFTPQMDLRTQFAQKLGLQNMNQSVAPPTLNEMLPDDKKHVDVPDELANILTRDYTSLVKKFNK